MKSQCVLSKIGGCYSNSGKTAVLLAFSGVVIKHCSLGGMFVLDHSPMFIIRLAGDFKTEGT